MADLSQFKKLRSIRLLQALLRKWWGLELAFADERGYVIDHAEGKIFPSSNDFCRMALFSKEGFRSCNDSVKVVRDRLRTVRKRPILVHQCHLGFDVVAAPLHFDGKLAGFLFTGGSYHEEIPKSAKAQLLRKVKEYKPENAEDLEQSYESVPRLSERELAVLMDLVEYGAQDVVDYYNENVRRSLRPQPKSERQFSEIIGEAPVMHEIFALMEKIVASHATVLVHGESGTGKELIARAIHKYGPRAKKAFVVQNCSAFNDNLLESALFGHVRGAFTGAVKDHKGLFETADGGTFFLDEIGDMSPTLQVKLLRVLQEGTFSPVGATKEVKVDVRIIAASHKDLTAMVERGEFREDLYYRINVLKITAPPLRDRVEDIPTLCDYFVAKHYHGEGAPPVLSDEVLDRMRIYAWPGNIRELENEIGRLMVLAAGAPIVDASLLSPRIRDSATVASDKEPARPSPGASTGSLREMIEKVEAEVISQGLIRTHWNKSQLAKELGISRSNLIQKCTYYGLERKNV